MGYLTKDHRRTSYRLCLAVNKYYMGNNLYIVLWVPVIKGMLGGLYLPYLQPIDYGMGTVLYWGKSVISSGFGVRFYAGGFKISGGVIKGSLRWASPQTRIVDTRLYFAAFFRMDAIRSLSYKYKYIRHVVVD